MGYSALSGQQTISGAYDRIESHEDLCAERYANIHASIGDIKAWMKWGVGGVLALAASLFGFMAQELYANNAERMDRLERPAAYVGTPR